MTSRMPTIYGTAILNAKGQVVIPAKARAILSWMKGTRLVIMSNRGNRGVVILRSEEIEGRIKKL